MNNMNNLPRRLHYLYVCLKGLYDSDCLRQLALLGLGFRRLKTLTVSLGVREAQYRIDYYLLFYNNAKKGLEKPIFAHFALF